MTVYLSNIYSLSDFQRNTRDHIAKLKESGAPAVQTLLMPVSARRQLNDLPDDMWTRISIEFYKDAADAVFKALVE